MDTNSNKQRKPFGVPDPGIGEDSCSLPQVEPDGFSAETAVPIGENSAENIPVSQMDTNSNKPRKPFGVPDPGIGEDSCSLPQVEPHRISAETAVSIRKNSAENSLTSHNSKTKKRDWGVPPVGKDHEYIKPIEGKDNDWEPPYHDDPPPPNDDTKPELVGFGSVLKSPILSSLSVLAISVCLLFLLNQLLVFIQMVENSPLPVRMASWLAFGLLGIALLLSVFRLCWSFRRLQSNPEITIPNASTLSAIKKAWSATSLDPSKVAAILAIIRNYPKDPTQKKLLNRGKLNFEEFERNLRYLDQSETPIDDDWLKNCQAHYVEPLEKCAKQLVHDYSIRVGFKTALVRNSMLDSIIILINAVLMFEELCRVFNVRTTRINSIVMVGRLAFMTMISAKTNEVIDNGIDHFAQGASATFGEMFTALLVKLGLKVGAEGVVNYFLFRKLGLAAISVLMPIRVK